jgi:hypothetical protein
MPTPQVQGDSLFFCTKDIVGTGVTPDSPFVVPDSPNAWDDTVVVGNTRPKPKAISELFRPVMEAGFQFRAPAESMGAATAAPPML